MKIYLDNAATTPVAKEVLEAMLPYFSEKFGNASSIHSYGREAKEAIEKSRENIANKLNAEPGEIIFTSGGTEANNFALKGIAL
ncbi:MAG: cysteine desulfurase NifS, partial [Candidatus Altiarchaeales archaeon A3]